MAYGDGFPKPDGTFDYYGLNDPAHKPFTANNLEGFSVNVFQWNDGKKGKCLKQFKGYKDAPEYVYEKALKFIRSGCVDDEYSEQKKIIKWAREAIDLHPELAFLSCSLNGMNRSDGASAMAIASGMVAGEPDLFLPCARHKYHGLFIELKRVKGGKVSADQRRWLTFLNSEGYFAQVAKGHKEAIAMIKFYIGAK